MGCLRKYGAFYTWSKNEKVQCSGLRRIYFRVIQSCFFLIATLSLKHSNFRVITYLWNTQGILFCQVCCRFLHLWKYCMGVDGSKTGIISRSWELCDQLLRFLLLAKALFSLNAHCRTVCSLLDGKGVHLMGKHYPYSLLKVSIFKWGLNISVSV
jgi:hypothetical protein